MARSRFTLTSFLLRLLFALVLVFASYNPLEFGSYYHWALRPMMESLDSFSIEKGMVGVALLIGWGVFLGATFQSLGALGTVLVIAFFGLIFWWMIDSGWISLDQPNTLSWLLLFGLSGVLAAGISWSHIRRRLTGQIDVEDAEN